MPILPKIFRPVTQNTNFYIWPNHITCKSDCVYLNYLLGAVQRSFHLVTSADIEKVARSFLKPASDRDWEEKKDERERSSQYELDQ